MKPLFSCLFMSLFGLLLLGSSCQYHCGSPLGTSYDTISVTITDNVSTAAELTVLMKDALSDQLMQEPGLSLVTSDDSDLALNLKIKSYKTGKALSVRKRTSRLTSDNQSRYETELYSMNLVVEYTLIDSTKPDTPLLAGTETGESFMQTAHDSNVALLPALRAAAQNAAQKITTRIVSIGEK